MLQMRQTQPNLGTQHRRQIAMLDSLPQDLKYKAVRAELKERQGLIPHRRWAHEVTHPRDLGRLPTKEELAKESKPEFPGDVTCVYS